MSLCDRTQRNQREKQSRVGGRAWRAVRSQRGCPWRLPGEAGAWSTAASGGGWQRGMAGRKVVGFQSDLDVRVDYLRLFILERRETPPDLFIFF